ncbi:MAG: MBL fold metallo-hydrolase [Actinobacteria bacterium]|nr:MBL fold metallo-hydrolase [Actinomycetota bacterium]
MASDVLELAERLWNGEVEIESVHPVSLPVTSRLAEPAHGVAFVPSFANVSAVSTGDGLVLVDTGSAPLAASVKAEIRRWSPERLNTAIYSHGHIDHVFGVGPYEEEARSMNWPAPVVIAHRGVPERFDRYKLTAGYNSVINQRQFQLPGFSWPTEYRYPDRTYDQHLALDVGGVEVELHHALGETDDHTWTWVETHRLVCCGDLFIWASPNAGNPQKVQRYPLEWAAALRQIAIKEPEILLPGHGFPVLGADRVATALLDTAELLESLCEQTLTLMNQGARLDEVLHTVTPPAQLMERPYLRPIYDDPEFIVHTIWRRYGGWYDGNPSTLKPARESAVAAELANLAGGAKVLANRAVALMEAGDLRLAAHLAELAALAAPADMSVHATRAEVFSKRAMEESSTMARGIFAAAAADSKQAMGLTAS